VSAAGQVFDLQMFTDVVRLFGRFLRGVAACITQQCVGHVLFGYKFMGFAERKGVQLQSMSRGTPGIT
jgi:hypothetical protein